MALRLLAGRIGAAAAAAGVGLSGAVHCDSKEPAGPSFDPEALERGAAALREINKSPYAKKVPSISWRCSQSAAQHQCLLLSSVTVRPAPLHAGTGAALSFPWQHRGPGV